MRKRPAPATTNQALDIFDDERFAAAMSAATRPAAEAVLVEPSRPPPTVSSPATSPESPTPEAQAAPRSTPTTPWHPGKRKASAPSALETQVPPEANVPLKFRVPQTLRSEFHRFKADLAAALGVALDDSNLARPLVEIFLIEQRERVLEEALAFRGRIKRPPNGDAVGMAEFDHSIGEIFRKARRRRTPGTESGSAMS